MSKREQRRQQSSSWQNAAKSMSLEEASSLGYGFDIKDLEPAIPENAIVPSDDGAFVYKRFQLKPTGILIPDDLKDDEWLDMFAILRKLDEAIQWAVGDLVNHAETKWGKTYEDLAEITGYNEKTLRDYAYVARSVQMSIRIDKLSFGHHQLVAGMKDKETSEPLLMEQKKWLELAAENNWSIKALREAIASERNKPILTTKKLKPWEEKIKRLKDDDFSPKKWSKLSKPERQDAMSQLNTLLMQLEEMGLD